MTVSGDSVSASRFERQTISNDELNNLPLGAYQGKVHVVTEPRQVQQMKRDLMNHRVVGFDTETRPSFRKGQVYSVALIQLATPERVYLVRTHHTGIPDELVSLLEEEGLVKAGVAIRDDIKGLQKLKPFKPGGFIDLALEAREAGLQVESVKKLTGLLLGYRISKSAQTSNWEIPTLTEKQIEYAATDAWVCLQIYHRLCGQPL